MSRLILLAQDDGWDVCVVSTPDGLKFLDMPAMVSLTGHPVRHRYKDPGDPDVLPLPDAVAAVPATVNTINKWAAGIADTLALGLLVESLGRGLPMVTMPYTNEAMAAHPAFGESLRRLRSWGVRVLYGDEVYRLHPPGAGEHTLHGFPWHLVVGELRHPSPTGPVTGMFVQDAGPADVVG